METFNELIDKAKQHAHIDKDSHLAARLGVSRQSVSHWRNGVSTPDEKSAVELGAMAGMDAGDALIMIQAVRAKTENEQRYWKKFLQRASVVVVVIALNGIVFSELVPFAHVIHYAQYAALAWFLTCAALSVNNPSRSHAKRSVPAALA